MRKGENDSYIAMCYFFLKLKEREHKLFELKIVTSSYNCLHKIIMIIISWNYITLGKKILLLNSNVYSKLYNCIWIISMR